MDKKEQFNSYLEQIKLLGEERLSKDTSLWPAELITTLAMGLYEKEIKERVDKVMKTRDNVIKFDRSSKPPVDIL